MTSRTWVILGLMLPAAHAARGQATATPDTATEQVRSVLRAYYRNYKSGNWDALAAYVLSPKLLERRGIPADSARVLRDRTRPRIVAHAVLPPASCPSPESPMLQAAAIRVDGDWAEVSVARCNGPRGGVDEFRLLYFESRWRFIYSDMF